MKNIALTCLFLTLLTAGLSSCKKCYSCDFGGGQVREYCSKDFPDKTDGLMLTIEGYEARGYKCTEK